MVSFYQARSDVVFKSLPRYLQEGTATTDSEKDLPIYLKEMTKYLIRNNTKTTKLIYMTSSNRIHSYFLRYSGRSTGNQLYRYLLVGTLANSISRI